MFNFRRARLLSPVFSRSVWPLPFLLPGRNARGIREPKTACRRHVDQMAIDSISGHFWGVARVVALALAAAWGGGVVAHAIEDAGIAVTDRAVAESRGGSDTERAAGQVEWATGTALAERLTAPVGVTLGASPLREGLYRFGRMQGVGVLLDRRIDPGREVHVALHQTPLGEALRKVAEAGSIGVTQVGPLFYFGPVTATSKLRTLAAIKREEVKGLPHDVALRLTRARAWGWTDLAAPRDLVRSLAEEGQLQVEGLDRIPRDLWAAADLPPLSLLDRLTVIALQFDLTFAISSDGVVIRFIPLPDEIAVVRRYPGGAQAAEVAEKMARLAPASRVRVVGDEVYVKGTVEEHDRLSASRKPSRGGPAADAPKETRIERLTVENVPVGAVLKQMASQLDLELKYDHAALGRAGASLNTLISVQVERISLDDLLKEVTDAAGLSYHREGRLVEIRPKDQRPTNK